MRASRISLGLLLGLVLFAPIADAVNYTEDFNSYNLLGFNPQLKPSPTPAWYTYSEFSNVGNVTSSAPILEGSQSFRIANSDATNFTNAADKFTLTTPIQLTNVNFTVQGKTITDTGVGTQQVITLTSSFPVRRFAEFYIFCTNDTGNTSLNDACKLNVRWQTVDATGQTLIPYTTNLKRFTTNVTFNWTTSQFDLNVNGVDDGWFPFFDLPADYATIQFAQYRSDIPMNLTLDPYTVVGAANVTASVVDGDVANGIKDFATNMSFTSGTSLFVFGLVIFIAMMAALIAAMFSHGKSNAIAPAAGFYGVSVVFWLIQMQFWPDWLSVMFIIIVSSMIGLVLRRVMLGISNAAIGPSVVVGSLGYFIICASFLSMAGYSQSQVFIPSGTVEQAGSTDQSFVGAVAECVVTLFGDCNQHTESKLWKTITDIFGWIQAAFEFLFQLLTFQLPIPVILNIFIVFPPAATLAAYAIQVIRG